MADSAQPGLRRDDSTSNVCLPVQRVVGNVSERAEPLVSVAIIVALYGDSRFSRCAIGLKTSAFTAPIITSPMRSRPEADVDRPRFLVRAFEAGAPLIGPFAARTLNRL